MFDPTLRPEGHELDQGAPLLLGSRGDEVTPNVTHRFSTHEPQFKFRDGWARRGDQGSVAAFPLDLGSGPRHPIGVELTHLPGPGAWKGSSKATEE